MKKIGISMIIAIVLCMCAGFTIRCFAEEAPITETEINEQIEDETSNVDRIVASITNSTFWVIAGSVLAGLVSIVAVFHKQFSSIILLMKTKASAEEVGKALKNAQEEIASTFNEGYFNILKQLESEQETTKKLTIMLSIFMSNAKINANAKAEIMQIMSGIKDISGNVNDVVNKINAAIEEANKTEEKPETPVLNEIVQEITQPSLSLE